MDEYTVAYDEDAGVYVATSPDDVFESDCPELAYMWLAGQIGEGE